MSTIRWGIGEVRYLPEIFTHHDYSGVYYSPIDNEIFILTYIGMKNPLRGPKMPVWKCEFGDITLKDVVVKHGAEVYLGEL